MKAPGTILEKTKAARAEGGERGAAMMIALLFFVAASVMIVIGMTGPTAREYSVAGSAYVSKESYYAAESAAEDVYYRFKNGIPPGGSETLAMPVGSATATLSSFGTDEKEIVSTGSVQNSQRAVDIKHDDGTTDYDIKAWVETQ